jgi:hypothetical protein
MLKRRDADPDERREQCGKEKQWPHYVQRFLLIGLGVENLREAWGNWNSHPMLSLFNLVIALAISTMVILTWPKKRQ